MAIVNDPGQDLLGGDNTPEAPIDPNAPQIRVCLSRKTFHFFRLLLEKYLIGRKIVVV